MNPGLGHREQPGLLHPDQESSRIEAQVRDWFAMKAAVLGFQVSDGQPPTRGKAASNRVQHLVNVVDVVEGHGADRHVDAGWRQWRRDEIAHFCPDSGLLGRLSLGRESVDHPGGQIDAQHGLGDRCQRQADQASAAANIEQTLAGCQWDLLCDGGDDIHGHGATARLFVPGGSFGVEGG